MKALHHACRLTTYAGMVIVGAGMLRAGILGHSDYTTALLCGIGLAVAVFSFLLSLGIDR